MKYRMLMAFFIMNAAIVCGQGRYNIVINEIMMDPTPMVGLPNHEWVELKNVSSIPINIRGWRLYDRSGQSGAMPDFILEPDSIVIVCAGSAVSAMAGFGKVIQVTSFPSLDNDDDLLYLKAVNGSVIHAVEYSSSWYGNELKEQGGWTLEMIDPGNPCSGRENWKASIDDKGGSPGQTNSINAVNIDRFPPSPLKAFTTDSSTIVIVFDQPVDSLLAAVASNYSVSNGVSITSISSIPPLFNQVQLAVHPALHQEEIYTIRILGVPDCQLNVMTEVDTVRTGIAIEPGAGELIINEILFNPQSNGYDYVEVYNNSDKIFNAEKLFIANRASNNVINAITPFTQFPFYIFPGDHLAITIDADNLAMHYLVKYPQQVTTLPSLPSFPDDEGTVVLVNSQGVILDEVNYHRDWHFKLLNNDEGVSLERIDPSGISQLAGNWHSAASGAGYGTPGYKNSQYRNMPASSATIEVMPSIFSPDNDGYNDVTAIRYQTGEPGYVANVVIFDAAGRLVRTLANNTLMGTQGYWNWDGLNEKNQPLPAGIYIIYTEIFNLKGKKQRFKNTIVLGKKLN